MIDQIEIVIGCVAVGASLAAVLGLTLWSRRIIHVVAQSKQQTARHLHHQIKHQRS